MRRWWPILAVALLSLPAALPYLYGDVPRTNDSLAHLYRAVELDRLIRAGIFFPRWAPGLAHGYGYPLFNYFAYFSHYLIVLFHIAGLPLLSALRASFALATAASGLAAYLLARDMSGGSKLAGAAAAAAYAYSPYLLYTAHVRGSLPENLALAFFPLALWSARRALIGYGAAAASKEPLTSRLKRFTSSSAFTYALIAVTAVAGFISSHLGLAIQYLPLVGVFGVYHLITRSYQHPPSHTPPPNRSGIWSLGGGILFLIFALALGLTAFLWLPAAEELKYVQFEIAFARAGLVYREHFNYGWELLAYPRLPVYTSVLNPPIVRALPLLASAVSAAGLLRLRTWRRERQLDYLCLFALFAAASFLTLDLSQPLWDAIGLLQRSAFPWRFIGPATLFAAVMAGMVIGGSPRSAADDQAEAAHRGQPFIPTLRPILAMALFIASAIPFLVPPREAAPENPTRADLARFEIPPLLVATTTTGEYTPIWVKEFPATGAQQAELINGREPERLDAALNPPAGASVEHLEARPAHDVYRVSNTQPMTAVYRSFYFPGWQVTLDGRPLPIRVTDPNGLISFEIPAGDHTLEVRFGPTPIRAAAGLLSLISILIVAYGLLRLAISRRAEQSSAARTAQTIGRPSLAVLFSSIAAALLAASLLLIAAFFALRPGPPAAQHPVELDFGGELLLRGYNVCTSPPACSPDTPTVTLVWQAPHRLGIAYGINLRLTDDSGIIWSDTNIERPRDWRFMPGTDFWPPDQFIYDSYILKPLPGAPPGAYHLEAIVYRADDLQALSVQRLGDYLIEQPTAQPRAAPLTALDGIALIEARADREAAAPGDPYRLTLLWQAAASPLADRSIQLDLVGADGVSAHTLSMSISPQYPPSRWQSGDVLAQSIFFRLPARLPSGEYHWRFEGAFDLPIRLRLTAPERAFAAPPLEHRLDVGLGESIRLLGYNVRASGSEITVDLAWQARQESAESYRVFLHLIDANGDLVSQSDGEPANWTRPTSGWLPGEVVIDSRRLNAPGAGRYQIFAGMVNEAGERLTANGWPEGAIPLGAITVNP